MKINAAIIENADDAFRIEEMELDPPKQDEVLVKIAACGVCHTDETVRRQLNPVPLPAVLGHEGSGVIEAVGPGVTDFKPGDKVGLSFGYCGKCEACRTGRPYGCRENRRLNFSGVYIDGTKRLHYGRSDVSSFFGQGAFSTYAVVHRNNLIPVPDDIPLWMAAPIGCGIQTGAGAVLNYLKPEAGSSVIITGCGTVGICSIMAAKIAGCSTIIACDIIDSRLELAKEFGATHTINAKTVESVPEEVKKLTDGLGTNYAIDCTGSGECVRQSLNCTRSLGVCAIVGGTRTLTIDVESELMGPAKTLGGVVEGCCIPQVFIPKLLDFYRQGRFPFDKLITRYKFSEINQAFQDMLTGKVIKPVLVMDE